MAIMEYRKLLISLCIANLCLIGYLLIPDLATKHYLENYASEVLRVSNTYTWKTYTGKEGMDYYTTELQKRLFLQHLEDNVHYVKQRQVRSECSVEKIRGVKIVNKHTALVYLTARYTKSDVNYNTSYLTDMVLVMRKDQGKWLVDNIIFKKGSVSK